MKNQLPRKYRIISRVGKANFRTDEARENRRVSKTECAHRKIERAHQHTCRVRRFDAPENIVSLRDAGMYNGFANDTKLAETLVLSGCSGGGGAPI